MEKLVELEMAASQAVLGTVGPVAEEVPTVTEPPKAIDWDPKNEATRLRYSQEKKDAVMTVAAELGVSTEGTTGEIHARILEAIKPVEPEVVEPEEVRQIAGGQAFQCLIVGRGQFVDIHQGAVLHRRNNEAALFVRVHVIGHEKLLCRQQQVYRNNGCRPADNLASRQRRGGAVA